MSRTVLDKELQELESQIVRLGALVDDALGKSLEALEKSDIAKAGMVIEGDEIIDSLRMAIEEHTIRLLTLQQPLGGRDLRFLASALSIAGDLERPFWDDDFAGGHPEVRRRPEATPGGHRAL